MHVGSRATKRAYPALRQFLKPVMLLLVVAKFLIGLLHWGTGCAVVAALFLGLITVYCHPALDRLDFLLVDLFLLRPKT